MSSKTPALIVTGLTFALLAFGLGLWRARLADQEQKNLSRKNLSEIAQAMQRYQRANGGKLPPGVVYDSGGKPLHSWRVLLLPYLGERALYDRFNLAEPWDSAHNVELLPFIPRVYQPPRAAAKADSTSTYYQVFDGYYHTLTDKERGHIMKVTKNYNLLFALQRTPFVSDVKLGLREILLPGQPVPLYRAAVAAYPDDWVSRDFYLVVEAGEPVAWTKPADLRYDPKEPLPKLGGIFASGFHAVRMDGYVEFVKRDTASEQRARPLIAPTGEIWERWND